MFAKSLIDRYASRPKQLANMSLAVFAVNYDVVSSHSSGSVDDGEGEDIDEGNENADCDEDRCIKLKGSLGYMHRRKHHAILQRDIK